MKSVLRKSPFFSHRSAPSRVWLAGGLIAASVAAAPVAFAHGDYTQAQAKRGGQAYGDHCEECHGSNLQGGAGPALAGKSFKGTLSYSKMSAAQLHHFIASQLPYNAPGSLSQKQYFAILAYILQQNDYSAGSQPLDKETISDVKLLPYPGSKKSG